jgi:hypothetical protein
MLLQLCSIKIYAMKTHAIILLTISLLGFKNQSNMNTQDEIKTTVNQLFIQSDAQNWSGVEALFAAEVFLDYSSMSGNPGSSLEPKQITDAWKTVLPGFKHTHHQIGNFVITINDNKAHVFCYGTATHYLEHDNGNVWTVVGTYDFDLKRMDNQWKITAMTFNYKYQDGNTNLIGAAIENAKSN